MATPEQTDTSPEARSAKASVDEVKRHAGLVAAAVNRAKAGIPEGTPRNKHGQSCAELVCEVCDHPFLAQWSQRETRKTCSMRCSAVLKQRTGGTRSGNANPNYKTGARTGERDRAGERRWYAALGISCERAECFGRRKGTLILHHVIYRQEVAREHGDVWDPRNAMSLCNACHTSHHRRGAVIALTELPGLAIEFACVLLGPEKSYNYLTRHYSGADPRVDGLLT